jgi:hypothetical protein
VRWPTFGALSRYDKSGGRACKPDSPDEFPISRPFCKLLKYKRWQHRIERQLRQCRQHRNILGHSLGTGWGSGRSQAHSARRAPFSTSACLVSHKPVVSRRNRSSDSSCRNLQPSTDTENADGAECIRTGLSTVGGKGKVLTSMNSLAAKHGGTLSSEIVWNEKATNLIVAQLTRLGTMGDFNEFNGERRHKLSGNNFTSASRNAFRLRRPINTWLYS